MRPEIAAQAQGYQLGRRRSAGPSSLAKLGRLKPQLAKRCSGMPDEVERGGISMSNEATSSSDRKRSPAEIELRRYELRMSLWKVVLGTMIVGLAGIIIPGFVNFYSTHFESLRKDAELRNVQQVAHQQYIKDFFDTAVNQDIELRIRFATYFANLAGGDQRELWISYQESQTNLRDQLRTLIQDIESEMYKLDPNGNQEFSSNAIAVKYRELERNRDWAYREIGYVPIQSEATSIPLPTKQELYEEAVLLVTKLAANMEPLNVGSKDWARFWTLYHVDLIGVESSEFARIMVAIGTELKRLVAEQVPPDSKLAALSIELDKRARDELAGAARPTAN
jgi:hypothetical protein